MSDDIKSILMERDGLTSEEADKEIKDASNEFYERLGNGESVEDFCGEMFGLEPDYIEELVNRIF
jgi:hypothetical protein